MNAKQYLAIGIVFALVGAVLAFALEDSDPAALGVSLRPLGGVLLAVGALLLCGFAIGSIRDDDNRQGEGAATSTGGTKGGFGDGGIRAIGGLIAVVSGVIAVAALAIVTLTQLGDQKSSIVAVSTSAFGVISAVVGAYLGIKATGDQTLDAASHAKSEAAVARREAAVTQEKLLAVTGKVEEIAPNQADEIKAAGYQAGEEATRTTRPPRGGRAR